MPTTFWIKQIMVVESTFPFPGSHHERIITTRRLIGEMPWKERFVCRRQG